MRGITVWQPWASAIALGIKRYETRSWLTPYRGPLAIHAAMRWRKGQREILQSVRAQCSHREAGLWGPVEQLRGCIIAVVELTDMHNTTTWRVPGSGLERLRQVSWGDFSDGRWAWRLERPAILAKPIPFRGSQTFFTVRDELIDSAR